MINHYIINYPTLASSYIRDHFEDFNVPDLSIYPNNDACIVVDLTMNNIECMEKGALLKRSVVKGLLSTLIQFRLAFKDLCQRYHLHDIKHFELWDADPKKCHQKMIDFYSFIWFNNGRYKKKPLIYYPYHNSNKITATLCRYPYWLEYHSRLQIESSIESHDNEPFNYFSSGIPKYGIYVGTDDSGNHRMFNIDYRKDTITLKFIDEYYEVIDIIFRNVKDMALRYTQKSIGQFSAPKIKLLSNDAHSVEYVFKEFVFYSGIKVDDDVILGVKECEKPCEEE